MVQETLAYSLSVFIGKKNMIFMENLGEAEESDLDGCENQLQVGCEMEED